MSAEDATRTTQRRYDRIAFCFDALEALMERRFRPWRHALWARVPPGRVLEIGVGTGKNLPHYPPGAAVTAVDLSAGMLWRALKRKEQLGAEVSLSQMDAQQLAFPDGSFDAVVGTFVFCSVPDPVAGLRELKRVLKPGGRIFLLEHVRSEQPVLGWCMDRLNPLVVRLVGANINRRTVENCRQAGLLLDSVEELTPGGLVLRLELKSIH
ncbi:MAG TPA: class I SAM-dependent methyltransferase [Methylococcaceae bacterium]|nr:class I SAM-dependent methyltransferase [Methylococcaceae bacterium]